MVPQFPAHLLVSKKRRIAHDYFAFRPFAFGVEFQRIVARVFARLGFFQRPGLAVEVRHKQGVFVLEAIQHLQDRRAVIVKAVVTPPLQIADLHGHLRQLEGVGIDFYGLQLRHRYLRLERKTKLRGKRDNLLFKSKQQLQRDVKKVSATARGSSTVTAESCFRNLASRSRCAAVPLPLTQAAASSPLMRAHSRRNGCIKTGSTRVLTSASLV